MDLLLLLVEDTGSVYACVRARAHAREMHDTAAIDFNI